MIDPESATTVTWECVHFGSLREGREEIGRCKERGFFATKINLTGIENETALMTEIASAMAFPQDFGMNQNALSDYLRDLSWLNPKGVFLVLENSKGLWHDPTIPGSLIEIWLFCAESWARDGIPFHLAFTWDS